MWNWLFGKKKKGGEEAQQAQKEQPPKQHTPQEKQQLEAESQWLYEFLIQYLTSPVWKIPIYDFIDANCLIFDEEEENKFEYTTIHKNFKDQIEAMVQQLMVDIGINEEQFYQMCMVGLKKKNHRKIFEQILIVDNFLVFKKLMVKRNKELELEALKELEKQEGGQPAEQKQAAGVIKQKEMEQEKRELEMAIAMSMAAQEEQKKVEDIADDELQQALLLSQASYKEEQMANSKLEEAQNKAISDSKIAEQQAKEKEQQKQEQQQKAAATAAVTAKPSEPKQQQQEEEKKEESKIQEPTKKEMSLVGNLPPLKANKNLNPIQPKYSGPVDDLLKKKEMLETQLNDYKKAEENIKSAQVEEKSGELTLEERKKKLLAQRELIRKKKQKQREEELKRFQELGQTEELQGEQKQEAIKKQESIALDLEKSMPQSYISADDRKKRADLYSKIKSNMENDDDDDLL